jgi:hypothetical protein
MISHTRTARPDIRWQIKLLLTTVLALSSAWVTAADPSTAITLDDITRAWTDREARLATAEANWKETVFHPRGSLFDSAELRGAGANRQPRVLPEQDTTVEVRCRLTVSGGSSRFERRGSQWLYDFAEFGEREYVSVFGTLDLLGEGNTVKPERGQFFSGVPGKLEPASFLRHDDVSPHAHDLSAFPASVAVRPADPRLRRPGFEGWQVMGERHLGRRPCVELERRTGRYNGSNAPRERFTRLWLDAERDFALVQYEEGEDEQVYFQCALENSQHANGDWLPMSWRTSSFRAVDPHDLTQQVDVAAVTWRFDEPLAADTFRVPKPLGTLVNDVGMRRSYRVGDARGAASGAEAKASEPGPRRARELVWSILTGVGACGLVVAVVAIALARILGVRRQALVDRAERGA